MNKSHHKTNANKPNTRHPWDGAIDQWAVVSSSGLRVDWFLNQSEAREFAVRDDSPGNSIHVVYGPGVRNRVAVRAEGRWYSPTEWDAARSIPGDCYPED